MSEKPLLIIHLDGVGHDTLRDAVADGQMPFVARLLENGYEAQPYRCGLPSTTPYVQAGILYGDNTDVAGFRWYDKRSGVGVAFGVASSFKRVAHRYLGQGHGLLEGGAAIAACYDGGASRTFGLSFKERRHGGGGDDASRILLRYFLNPLNVADVLWHLFYAAGRTLWHYLVRRAGGRRPPVTYVLADIAEEIFVHHLTRFAVKQAIQERQPVIYAGFYAYDETAHAFGPDDAFSEHMLRHVDKTLRVLFEAGRDYEVVVLSDHGQTPSKPFAETEGKRLDEVVSGWLPRYEVRDLKGKKSGPRDVALDGHVQIAASGGLAHVYLSDVSGRLDLDQVSERCPGLAERLAKHPGVHFVLARREGRCVVLDGGGERELDAAGELLGCFDDPSVLMAQLRKLGSFTTAGDLIAIGRFSDGRQVDFEDQLGGHGSIGGEQCHPFVLARSELGLQVRGINDAAELHNVLSELLPPTGGG